MRWVDQSIITMQFPCISARRNHPRMASLTGPLRADACRHLARPLLPAQLAAGRRRRARPGADRRHRCVRPAAGGRRGRRQHADQQGGHRVAFDAARLRRGLPVRPGRRGPAVGGHAAQLRQHALGRGAFCHRARPGGGAGRADHGARLQRQHALAHRRHPCARRAAACSTKGRPRSMAWRAPPPPSIWTSWTPGAR